MMNCEILQLIASVLYVTHHAIQFNLVETNKVQSTVLDMNASGS